MKPPTRPTLTEAQLLKARYDEARAIKEAWDHRAKQAHRRYAVALHTGAATEESRGILAAVEAQLEDAAGELRVALNAWMNHAIPTHGRRDH